MKSGIKKTMSRKVALDDYISHVTRMLRTYPTSALWQRELRKMEHKKRVDAIHAGETKEDDKRLDIQRDNVTLEMLETNFPGFRSGYIAEQ